MITSCIKCGVKLLIHSQTSKRHELHWGVQMTHIYIYIYVYRSCRLYNIALKMLESTASKCESKGKIVLRWLINNGCQYVNKRSAIWSTIKPCELCRIAFQNDLIHSKKVWVSDYQSYWGDQWMPVCIWIDLRWYRVYVALPSEWQDSLWPGMSFRV